MRIDVISIFPQYLEALDLSLLGKAQGSGLIDLQTHDLRDWTQDRHRTVDDTPYGGGAGMVMRADVWGNAIDSVLSGPMTATSDSAGEESAPRRILIIPTPSGDVFTQAHARELAAADQLIFACGRYEGIDARVAAHYREVDEVEVRELSIGDYVLNGGEAAALVMIEAIGRLVPGVVGNPQSLVEESHESGLLEYPSYTRPLNWRGQEVPEILLSGHHKNIERWRHLQALATTARRRPDLIAELDQSGLTQEERDVIAKATGE